MLSEEVLTWFRARIDVAYDEDHWGGAHEEAIIRFCSEGELSVLSFYVSEGELIASFDSKCAVHCAASVFSKRSSKSGGETLDSADKLSAHVFCMTVRHDSQDMDGYEQVLLHLSSVYAPAAVGAQNWPENISKDFSNGSRKFLASAVELYNQAKGSTVLYVPPLPDASVSLDKETVQRLEAMVIHWTRQIKEVVMGSSYGASDAAHTDGPLGELAFWRSRCVDFSRLHSQLQSASVQRILRILESNHSAYLAPFRVIEKDIEQGSIEAKDNMLYLSVLETPCLALTQVKEPGEIPQLLQSILTAVRLIWSTSLYYNTAERITTLLRKVSAEIIVRCSQCISVERIFSGADVPRSSRLLNQAVDVGKTWRSLYVKTATLIREQHKHTPLKWDETAEGTIFAQVDAFVQRCVDLLELCEGQLQFAPLPHTPLPPFGGSKGGDVFKSLLEIQKTFRLNVDKLTNAMRTFEYSALDVRASRWREDYAVFKTACKDLEIVYINVINLALDSQGGGIRALVEVVDNFWTLARREWIVNYLKKKASEVCAEFVEITNQIKKEFEVNRSDFSPGLLTNVQNLPTHAGAAAWAKGLHLRLNREWKALENLSHIVSFSKTAASNKQVTLVTETFHNLNSQLESYILTAFHLWLDELKSLETEDTSLLQRLDQALLNRTVAGASEADGIIVPALLQRTSKEGLLESNFDRELSRVLQEAYYWEKLQGAGIVVPYAAHEISAQKAEMTRTKEHVLAAVREYNVILGMLSNEERRLFTQHLSSLDARIAPGLTAASLTWKKENIQQDFVQGVLSKCAEVLEKVLVFKKNQTRILALCKEMGESLMVRIERKVVYRVEEFKQLQSDVRARVEASVFRANHVQIGEILKQSYNLFAGQDGDVQREWRVYVHKTDKRIEEALKRSMKASLQELARALKNSATLNADDSEVYPLFRAQAILDGIRMDFKPSINQIKDLLQSVCRDMTLVLTSLERLDVDKLTPACCAPAGPAGSSKGVTIGEEGEKELSYFEEISKDEEAVIKHVKEVLKLFNGCSLKLNEKLKWWSGSYQPIVSLDKDGFVKRYARMERSLSTVGQDIQRYRDVQSEIQQEEFKGVIAFVQVDYTALKQSLVQHCQQWVQKLTGLLHDQCRNELNAIYEYFRQSAAALSEPPSTFSQLEDKIALFTSCQAKLEEFSNRVRPIRDKYAKLAEFDVHPADENEQSRLAQLEHEFEVFRQSLGRADGLLAKTKKHMRGQLEADLAAFAQELRDLNLQFRETAPFSAVPETAATLAVYEQRQTLLAEYSEKVKEKREAENALVPKITLFQMEQQANLDLEAVDTEVRLLKGVWKLAEEWSGVKAREFESVSFAETDAELEVLKLIDSEFSDKLRTIASEESVAWTWEVFKKLSLEISTFSATLPLIKILKSPVIRPRHWDVLLKKVGVSDVSVDSPSFTLAKFFGLELTKHVELVEELGRRGASEERIERELKTMEGKWMKEIMLDVTEYMVRGMSRLKLRSSQDMVFSAIEEHSVALVVMKHSKSSVPFADKIELWEEKLSQVEDTVTNILTLQKLWTGLDAVLASDEGTAVLDVASIDMFKQADAFFSEAIEQIRIGSSLAVRVAKNVSMEKLVFHIGKLEMLVKQLDRYLEKKREQCPRLYLLADEELVECLSKDVESGVVQRYISRLFPGIESLEISQKTSSIFEVSSVADSLGDRVKLFKNISWDQAAGIDVWFNMLEKRTKETLRRLFSVCHNANITPKGMKKDKWLKENLGQLLCMSAAVHWNSEISAALLSAPTVGNKTSTLRTLKKQWIRQIAKLAEIGNKNTLTLLDRAKLNNVILTELQGKDNIESLVLNKCENISSFSFQMLLKHSTANNDPPATASPADPDYLPNIGTVVVSQLSCTTVHGHEFASSGVSGLVVTPLTERVFLALGCSVQLAMSGLVRGVSESGKTETVKEYAKLLGRPIAVVNCDELSHTGLFRLLAMSVQGGCFVCLDELNKLNVAILSGVSLMIRAVQNAVRERADQVILEGNQLKMSFPLTLFGTTGPYNTHARYFQQLWRPISLTKPDTGVIIEGLLSAAGSSDAKSLARKLLTVFELLPQQLTSNSNYAWGLRTVKAVVRAVCDAISSLGPSVDVAFENQAAVRGLLDSICPRLTDADLKSFQALLTIDIFPGVAPLEGQFSNKLDELVSTHKSRRGLAVVGVPLSGKSELISLLADKVSATVQVLYPSALNSTSEVSAVLEKLIKSAGGKPTLIVFDGPAHVAWTEQLNSLLDDTASYQTHTGERLTLPGNMRLVLETTSMEHLTPSTVSRVGVVFVGESSVNWKTLFHRLLLSTGIKANLNAELASLGDKWLPRLLQDGKHAVQAASQIVRSLCVMLKAVLTEYPHVPLERIFAFVCVAVIGRVSSNRANIDALVREIDNNVFPAGNNSVFDWTLSADSPTFIGWPDYRKMLPGTIGAAATVVGTPDLAVNLWLTRTYLKAGEMVLVRGGDGSGKRTILRLNLEASKGLLLVMHRPTQGRELQNALFARISRRIKNRFGPKSGTGNLLVAVEDLSLPETAGVTETLRQLLEKRALWRRMTGDKIVSAELEDVNFIGSTREARETTRTESSLWNRVSYVDTTVPDISSLSKIFGATAERLLRSFREDMRLMAEPLTSGTIALVQVLKSRNVRTSGGEWSLHDASKIFRGMLAAQGERCFDERTQLVGLWSHEVARVCSDRLETGVQELAKFERILDEVLEQQMQTKLKDVRHLFEGTVGRLDVGGEYKLLPDMNKTRTMLETKMKELNEVLRETGGSMITAVLFSDAVKQIMKMTRALAMSNGHVLAVGGKGSGRKGLGRLAAHLCKLVCTVLETEEDLREAIEKTGPTGHGGLAAIVEWNKAPNMHMLKSQTASIVATEGEVRPDLFGKVRGVLTNFHAIFVIENGEEFRRLIRDYPCISRTSEIVSFPTWPVSALAEVAKMKLGNAGPAIAQAMSELFNGGGGSLYSECVTWCGKVSEHKKLKLQKEVHFLEKALLKIEDARSIVETLMAGQEKERDELSKRDKECEDLNMVMLEKRMAFEEQEQTVDAEMVKIGKEEQDLNILTEDSQKELLKAMPALEAAVDALEKLDKKAIAEVKAYAKPPELVMKTMTAVMTVLDKAPTWAQAKIELNDVNFLPRLKTFDKDNISNSTLKKITNFTKDPTFQPSVVGKVSTAAGALCQWVHAMKLYADVFREVQPKRLKLQNAQETLERKHQLVKDMQEKLATTKAILQETEKTFAEASQKKELLQLSVEEIRVKLERAELMVNSLANDQAKWESRVDLLKMRMKAHAGDSLLGVFNVVFGTGSEKKSNEQLREILKKHKIVFSDDFDAVHFFMDSKERNLISMTDKHNALAACAVLKYRGDRFVPLVVDEYGILKNFLATHETLNPRIVNVTEEYPFKAIPSIAAGGAVMFDDLPLGTLEELASQSLRLAAGRESDELWNKTFFAVRELQRSPGGESAFFPVRFGVTQEALTETLIRVFMAREEPRMHEQARQAETKLFETRQKLSNVDSELLLSVANHKASLLEDAGGKLSSIIVSCGAAVAQAQEVIESNEQTVARIESAKEAYIAAAERCASFFEAMQTLKRLNPLYRPLSYDRFLDLFASLYERSSEKLDSMTSNVEDKVALFSTNFIVAVGKLVLRALPDRHRPVFFLSLAKQAIDPELQTQHKSSFDALAAALLSNAKTAKDLELVDEAAFKGLLLSFEQQDQDWKQWKKSEHVDREPLPGDWDAKLHSLQKLGLLKIFRPDRLLPAINTFVQACIPEIFKALSTELTDSPVGEDSKTIWPVTIVVGEEPEIPKNFRLVSAEQPDRVMEAVDQAMKTGTGVVVLQVERNISVCSRLHKRLVMGGWKSGFRLTLVVAICAYSGPFPIDLILHSSVIAVDRKPFAIPRAAGTAGKSTPLAILAGAISERQRQSGEDLGGYVDVSDLEIAALGGSSDTALKFMASAVGLGAKVWEPEKRELVNALIDDVVAGIVDDPLSGASHAGFVRRGEALCDALSISFGGRRVLAERGRDFYQNKLQALSGTLASLTFIDLEDASLEEGPVRAAIEREARKMNAWITWCRAEIRRLQRVFESGLFDQKDERILDALIVSGEIPTLWPCPYLKTNNFVNTSWTSELKQRVDGIRKLVEISGSQSIRAVNLRVLSNPQRFLAAVLLQSARRQNLAVDQLTFDCQPLSTTNAEEAVAHAPPKDGVYVEGLHLVSSEWDIESGSLVESASAVSHSIMPAVWFRPTKRSASNESTGNAIGGSTFSCPIYVTSDKRGRRDQPSFIFNMDLKSKTQSSNFWIKRGTCLLVHAPE